MISGIINVVLNIILCLILPQKVIAVAIATAVSKIVSAILVIRCIFRFDEVVKLSFRKIHFDFNSLKLILKFGIPVSISNLLLPIANLQIVPQINSYGVAATAGNTAGNDLLSIPSSFINGFSAATSTFMGQNIGAKKNERVRKVFWYTLIFSVVFGGIIGIFLYLTGEFWIGLVIGTSSVAAIEYAMIRMFYVTAFSFIHAYNCVLGSAEHAYGYPFLGTLKTILCVLVFRVIWMNFVYPLAPTFDTIMMCFTVSWLLIAIFNTIAVSIISMRYRKGLYKKI
jgi:Na+-driven multidrug efflux pump